jgi:flagellar basal-body rod modification protein FlgD
MTGIAGDSMKVKTEWSANPYARKEEQEVVPAGAMSRGRQLNEMAGITETKDPYKVSKKKELDKEAFLKMFMTQLKYQDPTSPVDNEKMAQQMAMFSQLEQSVTTNQYLEKILAKSGDNSEMAFGLIGKTITANQAAIYHSRLENTVFDIKLPQDASELKVEIVDEAGQTVRVLEFDKRPEGKFQVRWDGKTDDGQVANSGRYFYKVNAKGLNGEAITIENKLEGKVTGISRANGETYLLVGDRKVSMNEVSMVRETEASNENTADNKMAGTKSEFKEGKTEVTTDESKKKTSIEIGEGVKEALSGDKMGAATDPRLNSIMPLFMR